MDTRGEHRFSFLVKQNKKAKICFVICFAGFFFLNFFCYEVIVKQKIYKRASNYYSSGYVRSRPDLENEITHKDVHKKVKCDPCAISSCETNLVCESVFSHEREYCAFG